MALCIVIILKYTLFLKTACHRLAINYPSFNRSSTTFPYLKDLLQLENVPHYGDEILIKIYICVKKCLAFNNNPYMTTLTLENMILKKGKKEIL